MNPNLEQFKQQAIASGYSPEQVEAFLAQQGLSSAPQQEEKNFLEKIGSGAVNLGENMISPFVETFKNIGTATTAIPQAAIAQALRESNPELAAQIASKDILGTQSRAQEIQEDPEKAITDQVANSLEIGSYAIPFGKARKGAGFLEQIATQAALPGVAVGTLSSDETAKMLLGQEYSPEEIAGSAVLGATIPTVTNLGGRLAGKLRGGGTSLQEGVISKSPKNLKDASRLKKKNILQRLNELGAPKGSADKKLKWAIGKYDDLVVEYGTTLSKVNKPVNTTDIVKKSVSDASLVDDITKGAGKSNVDKWTKRLDDVADLKDLSNLKFDLLNERGGKTVKAQIADAFHKNVDSLLKQNDDLARLLDDMSLLHEAVGGRTKARGGGLLYAADRPNISVPLAQSVKIPGSRRFIQATQDIGGSAIGGIGGVTEDIFNVANKSLPQQTAIRYAQDKATETPSNEFSSLPENQIAQQSISQPQQQTLTGISADDYARGYARAIAAGNTRAASKLKTLYELEKNFGGGGEMTEKQTLFSSASVAAEDALRLLSQGGIKTGLGQKVIGKAGEKLGFNTKYQTQYRSNIAYARTLVKNALLGGAITPIESESLEAFIPEYNDAPEVAQQKLKNFISLTRQFSQQN